MTIFSSGQTQEVQFECQTDPKSILIEEFYNSDILNTSWFSRKKNLTFSGKSFVQWYCNQNKSSIDDAIKDGNELLRRKFILATNSKLSEFSDDPNVFYK